MHGFTQSDCGMLFISISVMIISAKIISHLLSRFQFPSVAGELLTGVLLGPTILGMVYPNLVTSVFPKTGTLALLLEVIFSLSMIILIFEAGLEIDVLKILQNKKSSFYTAILGLLVPFGAGFVLIYFYPHLLLNNIDLQSTVSTASVVGIALSISALPVLVRILNQLNLINHHIGIVIMSAAFITDIVAWLAFSILIRLHNHADLHTCIYGFIALLVFITMMLTLGRHLLGKYLFSRMINPANTLAIALGIALICASITEYFGFHACLGAFIAGITLHHVLDKTILTTAIKSFVDGFFAPIFFVSIGLKLNFISNFDLALIFLIVILAFITKIIGASLGAYFSGINAQPSLAIGFGLNARGSVDIILCTIALNAGLITKNLFLAFVVMAMITSLTSGPIMSRLLRTA